jgi:adenylosuccinate lyase
MAAMENIALWHERDISHSSVERIIIPDSTILVDYMLVRLTGILRGIQVYPERMMENINKSYGLYNSQRILLRLIEKGMSREGAYRLVQGTAMQSWSGKKDFKELLKNDKEVKKFLSGTEIEKLFDLSYYLRNVDYIFKRVFLK